MRPYQGGYALNIYMTFSKASRAFSTEVPAATLMQPMVGDSSQFIPRTIKDMVDSLRRTGAAFDMLATYP
jgi:hypothetical protein